MMYSSTLLLNIRQKVGILIVFYPGSLKRTLYIGTLGVLLAGCNKPRAQEVVTCGDRSHFGLLYFPSPPFIACIHFCPETSLGFSLFFQHQFGTEMDIIPLVSLSILAPLLLPPSTSPLLRNQLSSQIG